MVEFDLGAVDLVGRDCLDPEVPSPAPRRLPWKPGRTSMGSFTPGGRTLTWFIDVLREAEVLDLNAIPVAGGQVVLPTGMAMVRRFGDLIRDEYEAIGLQEHDYPYLGPTSIYEAIGSVIDPAVSLLHAGTAADFARGVPRSTLSPTGEATVYHHWSQVVRTEADLPIGAFRHARYFRPVHRSRQASLFRPMEACDVYELHWAVASVEERARVLAASLGALRSVSRRIGLPVLWSVRPPWTNNAEVSLATIGGDALLPTGLTLQVASLYDQGTRFARRFDVSFDRDGATRYAEQVAGAVTRRMLLTHLFLGAAPDGGLLPHPEVAALHVAVVVPEEGSVAGPGLERRLRDAGLRTAVEVVGRRRVQASIRRWQRRGVAAVVVVLPDVEGRSRTVVVRSDDRSECRVGDDAVAAAVLEAVAGAASVSRARATAELRRGLATVASEAEAREAIEDGRVAVCALAPTEGAVLAVAGWGRGDVLGFLPGERGGRCITTGVPTDEVALVARYV